MRRLESIHANAGGRTGFGKTVTGPGRSWTSTPLDSPQNFTKAKPSREERDGERGSSARPRTNPWLRAILSLVRPTVLI